MEGRGFPDERYWVHHRDVLLNAGLTSCQPLVSLNSSTRRLLRSHRTPPTCAELLRSTTPGSIWCHVLKRFRKNLMKWPPHPNLRGNRDLSSRSACLKQAARPCTPSSGCLNTNGSRSRRHPDLEPLLKGRIIPSRQAPSNGLGVDARSILRLYLDLHLRERFEPMSDEETARLHSVEFGLRPIEVQQAREAARPLHAPRHPHQTGQ